MVIVPPIADGIYAAINFVGRVRHGWHLEEKNGVNYGWNDVFNDTPQPLRTKD
jgi:hypothetical protein